MLWRIVFLFVLFFLSAVKLTAQLNVANSVMSAMGSSGSAYVGGVLAFGVNPSRVLAYEFHEQRATVTIFPAGLMLNSNAINLELYNALFGRKTRGVVGDETEWTDDDKRKLRDAVDKTLELNGHASVMLFGASYFHNEDKWGAFGFHIIDCFGGRGSLNREFLEYVLYGNEQFLGRNVGGRNTTSNAYWYREYALSYAHKFSTSFRARNLRPIESIKVGASIKWIATHAYVELEDESSIYHSPTGDSLAVTLRYAVASAARGRLQDPNSTESFSPFPKSVGNGLGLDVGLSFNYRENMTFAISLNNLGFVSFDKNTLLKTVETTVIFTGLTDPISGERNEQQLDSLAHKARAQTRSTNGFTRALPTHLRIGFAWMSDKEVSIPVVLAADYVQGFNNHFGNTGVPMLGVGTEIRLVRQMPIRTGIQLGGRQGFVWSFGLGYDHQNLAIDFNTGTIAWLFAPSRVRHLAFGLALRIRFLDVEN